MSVVSFFEGFTFFFEWEIFGVVESFTLFTSYLSSIYLFIDLLNFLPRLLSCAWIAANPSEVLELLALDVPLCHFREYSSISWMGNFSSATVLDVQENGTSVTKMSVPVTAEEKTNKKNDVKARSLLLMALPNEHQLTFSQYTDAKTMFVAIETRFGGSRRFLPPEWNTHVVVWMNKVEIETMSIDDLYNNFKIVEQSVKKSVGASSGAQNLAFMTAPSTSSTNDVNTAKPAYEVSTVSPNVNTASPQVSTASFSDNVVYAFMVENPNGSNLLQQDLEQIHEDDLEAMDLKWQLSLLSMRAKRYFQRTGKKIFINANDTAGYDKSKVECFNCHKMGHFARECRAPRNKEAGSNNESMPRSLLKTSYLAIPDEQYSYFNDSLPRVTNLIVPRGLPAVTGATTGPPPDHRSTVVDRQSLLAGFCSDGKWARVWIGWSVGRFDWVPGLSDRSPGPPRGANVH
ncbi:ribonuclease H-like domain-containing protein [Tanacetum coccineum]